MSQVPDEKDAELRRLHAEADAREREIRDRDEREHRQETLIARLHGEAAVHAGNVAALASVTRPFCGGCTRARLSAEGKLFTCLFAVAGHDLRALLRGGASDVEISAAIGGIWGMREDRYSELRTAATAGLPKVEMSYIGG